MMVGESGRVLCLDRDEHNISLAEKNLQTVGVYNHDLLCGDFYDAIGIASNYNVIVMMNSLCYLDDYLGFLAEISKKMRPGARIIIKDFDMQAFIFSGIPAVRWGNLIESAMRYDRTKENPLPYKNFFGRYIHSLHRMLRIDSFKNDVWSQNINYPFTDSSKKYIWENIRSLLDQAKDLDCVERDFFIKVFNENDGIFYKNDDSMVVETEFITTLNL
jgi:SAM-dependent methyltransferase